MPILTAGKTNNSGYAYLMLLVTVASGCLIAALLGAAAFTRAIRADRESELIFRGLAYAEAIKSYYNASKGMKTYPTGLEDLLSDPRFPDKKHIRKLYADPITRKEWVLVVHPAGGITGVASRSAAKPLKRAGFEGKLKNFNDAEHYSEWIFSGMP